MRTKKPGLRAMANKTFAAAAVLAVFITAGCSSLSYNKKVRYMEISGRGCYVCERMDPVVDEISKEFGNVVDIYTYSETSDAGTDLVKKYNITKFPSNIMTDEKGDVFFRYDGLLDVPAIRDILRTRGIGVTPAAAVQNARPSAVTKTPGETLK